GSITPGRIYLPFASIILSALIFPIAFFNDFIFPFSIRILVLTIPLKGITAFAFLITTSQVLSKVLSLFQLILIYFFINNRRDLDQLSFHDKQIKCLCMKLSDETAAIFNFIHTLHSENTKKSYILFRKI